MTYDDDEQEPDGDGDWPEDESYTAGPVQVGQQIRDVRGDAIYHEGDIYVVGPGDPPEERHQAAIRLLDGDKPRESEKLLFQLLREPSGSPERVYYYLLSALSGRSWHDLGAEVTSDLRFARKIADSYPRDGYSQALDVVWRLVEQMRDVSESRGESGCLLDVDDAIAELPLERQDEITRHLDTVLGGVAGERTEAGNVHRVVVQRLSGRRAERAKLFFEPKPAMPRCDLVSATTPEATDWGYALGGGAVVALGAALLLIGPIGPGAALGMLTLAMAARLLVRHGAQHRTLKLCAQTKHDESELPDWRAGPRSPRHWVRTDFTSFVQEVHRLIELRFSEARPHRGGNWPSYTEVARARLEFRLVDRYGNEGSPAADRLDWLIRWHARQAATAWRPHDPVEEAAAAEPSRADWYLNFGALGALSSLILLGFSGQWLAVPFLGSGGAAMVTGVVGVRSQRALARFHQARAEQRHQEEVAAYREWLEVLAERPRDEEVARWLAMDKIYVRTDAVRRAGLTTHDLVTHVVTAEGTKDARRAHVRRGPVRYSSYHVQVFLLTRSGVRWSKAELDFLTGEVKNEQRTVFQYDNLASADVTERGVRTTKPGDVRPIDVERLRSRKLRLTLLNGKDVAVIGGTLARTQDLKLADDDDDYQWLAALRSSGADVAIPILEAVAAEGSDWIAREQERRRRWAEDWGG